MATGFPALFEAAETFLTRRRPGRALTWLARTPIPFVTPDRIAALLPDPDLEAISPSPLVDGNPERPPPPPGILEGGVVIKDQIDVAGMRTGVGMADGGEVATTDAPIVARIVAAGGHILGKAKMTELGIDGIGALMHYAMPRNPRAPGYIPGGSSTGTAVAVAAGLARYGIGGDGLGSIRIPAAYCGLVGLKPSRTRYPRIGIQSPVRTLDAVGPITRTVDDCARLWQVMADEPIVTLSAAVPARLGVPLLRLPWRVARSVWAGFVRALAALGAPTDPVELRGLESATFLGGMIGAHEMASGPFAGRTRTQSGRMSLAIGRSFSPLDVARLERQREALRVATERVLERTPILAMPTTAIPPPALSRVLLAGRNDLTVIRSIGGFTPLANLLDLPAIAVPCGVDERGRPLSIMFVGARGSETALLRLALAVEQTGLGTRPL
ncbi:MAG: amidase [Myxococcota bacterium]|nr:amidase [Myxococcota bacterium]